MPEMGNVHVPKLVFTSDMQAVILAAGEGKRMRPLTLERPKPLLEVAGKPLIEHVLDALPEVIREVIIVIGYKGAMVRGRLGARRGARRIRYVTQEEPLGTAAALALAGPCLAKGSFLVMCADDIHGPLALQEAVRYPLALLVCEHPEPARFGVVEVDDDGMLRSIEEKPSVARSNLVSTGAMVLDERIFAEPLSRHGNGERYLTDQLATLARRAAVRVVRQPSWIAVGYPADIERAERALEESSRPGAT
jgi:bifunctional UDP-N-acetylglucosamine pyrophosphorylase/glucosamine-1-phosphate N-acetyltransferase